MRIIERQLAAIPVETPASNCPITTTGDEDGRASTKGRNGEYPARMRFFA